jgi:hypothetical protein
MDPNSVLVMESTTGFLTASLMEYWMVHNKLLIMGRNTAPSTIAIVIDVIASKDVVHAIAQ